MDGVPLEWVRAAFRFSRSASSASSFSYLDDDNTSPVAVTGDTNLDNLGKDPRFRRLLELYYSLQRQGPTHRRPVREHRFQNNAFSCICRVLRNDNCWLPHIEQLNSKD
jgi:hypothetical protein